MLIKEWDRLTLDGYLAVVSCLKRGDRVPFERLLETVGQKRRAGHEPPLAEGFESAIRILGCSLSDLKAAGSRLCSTIVDLKDKPQEFSDYLASEAHEELAFTYQPLLTAYFPGTDGAARLLTVRAGRTGRKYARSARETVDFLMDHPEYASVLGDVAHRFRLSSPIENAAELERFIDAAPEVRLDAVIDEAELAIDYLFDAKQFGGEVASKKDWFFEPNPASRSTLDFQAVPAGDYRPSAASLGVAELELSETLAETRLFAEKAGIAEDAASFADGLRILKEGLPPDPFWTFCGLSPDRQRIAMAGLLSDNFAGMASWNDVPIEKDATYRRLSNKTVFCILQSICAAATSEVA